MSNGPVIGDAVDVLPNGYIQHGNSSNWWIFDLFVNDYGNPNVGATVTCYVPEGPNSTNLGGVGILPNDQETTIYFWCGLACKTYGGNTTTFDSLDATTCKAWVELALPPGSPGDGGGCDVSADEGNVTFTVPTTTASNGIVNATRDQALAGLIIPITWSQQQTGSQYIPVTLKKSHLITTQYQNGNKPVNSLEWRPYVPANGDGAPWTNGFCRFKATTVNDLGYNPNTTEVAMGFSGGDPVGSTPAGEYNTVMYPNDGNGIYPSRTFSIFFPTPIPQMSQSTGQINIYQQVAMPLIGGDPGGGDQFGLGSLNGVWYLKAGKTFDGDPNSYDQVKIGEGGANNVISTLSGVYPIPLTGNT